MEIEKFSQQMNIGENKMTESKVTINTPPSDIQIKGVSNLIKQVEGRSYQEYLYNFDEQKIGRVNLKVESLEFFDEEEINRLATEERERSIEKEVATNSQEAPQKKLYTPFFPSIPLITPEGIDCKSISSLPKKPSKTKREGVNSEELIHSPEYKRLNELARDSLEKEFAKKLWEEAMGCNEPFVNYPEGLKALGHTSTKKERKKRGVNLNKQTVFFDNHFYSFATHTLITDDKPVPLSEGDMKLLELFLLNANKILSKEDIFKKIDMIPHKSALGSRVLRLRKLGIKIENIMRRGWVLYTNKIGEAK